MNIQVNDKSSCKKEVCVEVPAEEVNKAFTKAIENFNRQVSIPGFRRGKAPKKNIQIHYGKEVHDQIVETFFPKVVNRTLIELKINPIGQAVIQEADLIEGQPLSLKFQVEFIPQIQLNPYHGLKITKEVHQITSEDVERALFDLRKMYGSSNSVEDRPVQNGDFVDFECNGYLNSAEENSHESDQPETCIFSISPEDILIEADDEVNKHLIGMIVGEVKEVSIVFESGKIKDQFVGKPIRSVFKLISIRERELPELTDEFIKATIKPHESFEGLKEYLLDFLQKQAKTNAESKMELDLLNQVVEQVDTDVPSALIEERTKELIDMSLKKFASSMNISVSDLKQSLIKTKVDLTKVWDDHAVQAYQDIKRSLVVEEIKKQEKIVVTNEEILEEIAKMAEQIGQPVEKALSEITPQPQMMTSIHNILCDRKVLQLLVSSAQIEEVSV